MMGMALKRFQELAARDFKNLDELIGPASGQLGAVRTETDPEDLVAVAIFDFHDLFAGRNLKNFDFAVLTGRAAASGQQLAIRRKTQGHDAIHEASDFLSEHS